MATETPYKLLEDDFELLSSSGMMDGLNWTAPLDLDSYLERVYSYYRGKGFSCAVLSRLFNLLTFTWLSLLLLFIFAFFDFSTFSLTVWDFQNSIPFLFVIFIFFSAWIAVLAFYVWEIYRLFEMRYFFANVLGVTEEELPTKQWSDIVDCLTLIPGLCRSQQLTNLHIAQRILRKENYLIALITKDKLALRLPFSRTNIITTSLEWSLSLTVFSILFPNSSLTYSREEILTNISLRNQLTTKLKKRFIMVGIISLLFSPIVFILLVTYYILKFGEELRNKPNNLGLRNWSRYAHWYFREYNEFTHDLEDRLNLAAPSAMSYVDQFTSNMLILSSRFGVFVCGSVVISIVVSAFFNPSILDDDLFLNRNGLWWLAVCGGLLAMCRALLPEEHFVFQPEHYFEAVRSHTHTMPRHWKDCRSPVVWSEFGKLFQYRVTSVLLESLSVLFVPLIFLFSLPACAEEVVLFIYDNTLEHSEVGSICSFSDFSFTAPKGLAASFIASDPADAPTDFKLEQSFLSFSAKNKLWKPEEGGKQIIEELAHFATENDPNLFTSFMGENDSLEDSILQLSLSELSLLHQKFQKEESQSFALP